MIIKGITDEDFVNYHLPSMFIAFPRCTFKCEKECGIQCCQNAALANEPLISISEKELVRRYMENPISRALVCGGLEPFDSYQDLTELIKAFRAYSSDDIVIYTGYEKDEIEALVEMLKPFKNIVIKFGRYIPNREPIDSILLGVTLASDNQYAERIC